MERASNHPVPKISLILPVLNEAHNLASVLATVQAGKDIEVIVVDGGSQDDTVAVGRSLAAQVISSPPGRAAQMNAGAAIARGDILLFLHADTHLPSGFAALVTQTLAQPGVVAAAFRLKIDGPELGLRLVEWGVYWRSRLFQLPYGDQAIFLKKSIFHRIGGFLDLPIMEDFELIGRLRRLGRVAIAPATVLTSPRRWQKLGVFRTTFTNQLVILAYWLGVSPVAIARLYRGRRH